MLDYFSILVYSLPAIFIGNQLVWYFSTLSQSRSFTKSSPIPSVTIYSRRDDIIFWLLSPKLAPLIKSLPFGCGKWVQYVEMDFPWVCRHKSQAEQLGSGLYWVAAPGGSTLIVCDAEIIAEVTHRWKDFPKPVIAYKLLNIMGPNVVTTEGADWQRHRKITGPPFNERNSRSVDTDNRRVLLTIYSLVFKETLTQARAMLISFTSNPEGEADPGQEPVVEDLVHWTMTIALNVISGAAFGMNLLWPTTSVAAPHVHRLDDNQGQDSHIKSTKVTNQHIMSFQQSVETLITSVPYLIFFPKRVLQNSPSKAMRQMPQASDEFVSYLRELISGGKHSLTKSTKNQLGESVSTQGDLLGNIIKSSTDNRSTALDEEETIGNMFIFMIGGHETTATTMQAAIILLACNPKIRQSIQEEIDRIWASKNDGEDLSYDDYPKMRSLMAVMVSPSHLQLEYYS
jgi:cytochrome P450